MSGWGGGWQRVRRRDRFGGAVDGLSGATGRWTPLDLVALVVGFAVHWELGLAFLVLKLWQQSTGYPGSVFGFAQDKWESLVHTTRSVLSGAALPSVSVGPRPSGDAGFDAWRQSELARLDGERARLRHADRDAVAHRDDLLRARTRDEFDLLAQLRAERARQ